MSAQGEHEEPAVMGLPTPAFDPTKPPSHRLVRLGVVFDGRTAGGALPPLARMCQRAGIDIVWIADSVPRTALVGNVDAWPVAAGLLDALPGISVGAMVGNRRGPADIAGLVAARLNPGSTGGTRLELGFVDGEVEPAFVHDVRERLSASGVEVRLSVVATSASQLASLLDVADDVVLSAWHTPDLETAADAVRAAAVDAGRDPGSLGVAALIPVSVGRTDAEAAARADMDPDFARFGHPAEVGIFGTLESCQDRVIALAHAGITDLRCVLPATPDVHDVIAQLTAMTVGTVEVLVPGSLRSPAPPPPAGWGGRPDRPPSPQISAGSRRRA